MPRKLGIFKRFQTEILDLLSGGIGYTEIAAILNEKHGVKTTKQNLEKSHKRHLKEESKTAPKKVKKKTDKIRVIKSPEIRLNNLTEEERASLWQGAGNLLQTYAYRRRVGDIKMSLEALLDCECASERFSASQMYQIRSWSKVLFAIHPETALATFEDCFRQDFEKYRKAVMKSLEVVKDEQLYNVHESLEIPFSEAVNYLFDSETIGGETITLNDQFETAVRALRAGKSLDDMDEENS
ncbi:hypothetical protein SH580_17075 [Coraliomargarita algicola]|uniref:Uncharacterized protein n=1 Tax=Coraliomargarita algicola TaxID=3092156 RepID=A0ABZ0RIR1_9BACT|nr:hypothetical protein [Coraliomargarita sp. J2-16]WPJ95139.1 hypothetical protein SH580_17075 [Coraliomargarita sp. J2-16]